jgi:ABC-type branched-subunit amino acid transport system substrate-binding protein
MDVLSSRPPPGKGPNDLTDSFELVFQDAYAQGKIDRPIELIHRNVQGLPRGSVKAVIDAFGELVDEGCLIVVGPHISENVVAVKQEIERRFRTPALTMAGSDKWLGEWTFNLCNGSMSDEPAFIAQLLAQKGQRKVGVLVERSTIGQEYLSFFRQFCEIEDLSIVAVATVAQNSFDARAAVAELKASGCDAVVHWGFGFGLYGVNDALAEIGWNPPRYMGTAFEIGYGNEERRALCMGWVGLEQYDEENPVAQAFLDRFQTAHGRRPEYFMPLIVHDFANCIVTALANATPLSPAGVKEALERVKMMPAACGSRGTRISFGEWTRRGWMGAGYLTAREFTGDGNRTVLRGRYGAD